MMTMQLPIHGAAGAGNHRSSLQSHEVRASTEAGARARRTLDEVTDDGRADAGEQRVSTLGLDDLAEAADHALVHVRLELHPSLDDIDRRQGTVGDAAADAAGERVLDLDARAGLLQNPVAAQGFR